MNRDVKTQENEALDRLFAEARSESYLPGDDFMARLMADAARNAPLRVSPSGPERHVGGVVGFLAALGGWPTLGGLAMATVAGLWIGIAPPDSLNDFAASVLGEEVTVSLFPDLDPFGLEG